jgi:DNA-binding response OmpR family regulator
MLPDGSGYGHLRSLKRGAGADRPRVVLLSALNEIDDYRNGCACGADDYLGKPFDFADLVRRVKRLC